MPFPILIIDDEVSLRQVTAQYISLEGFEVLEAGTLKEARQQLQRQSFSVVLCDVKLPDGNGVEFVKFLKENAPETEVILFTAYGNIHDGVQAIKLGAFDYLVKGDDNHKILPLLNKALEKAKLQFKIKELQNKLSAKTSFDNIIGKSETIQTAIKLAQRVAQTDTSVLLLGQTGVGKEVFAQAIHNASTYKNKALVALNCSAFGHELLESELFGHRMGAFTGAIKDKKGLLEEAHEGTLFLDEIGEMPLDLQAKLLRFLETGEFYKVGESKPTKVKVRVISATNRNLEKEAENHHFRLDLFYRLATFQIMIPSLDERREDIDALTNYFLLYFSEKLNVKIRKVSANFIQKLKNHHWKGNIRELRNVIERAMILCDDDLLDVQHLPFEMQEIGDSDALDLPTVEKNHIRKVLKLSQGNKTKTAEILGIGLTTLYRKIEEYQL